MVPLCSALVAVGQLWYSCVVPEQRIQRINVAVNADMVSAIDLVIETEHVSLTEAVRRLISYGDFVYRSQQDGKTLITKTADGSMREVVIL